MRNKKALITCVLLLAVVTASGCTSMIGTGKGEGGWFEMSGDSMGMEAFSDLIVGIQDEANAPGDQKNSYWQSSELNKQRRIATFKKPSFLGGNAK